MNIELEKADVEEQSGSPGGIENGITWIDGERYYKIANVDALDPFLINLVSPNNHWMFIASNGALTAGRRDADHALFPYCAQDKLFELANRVGSFTEMWVQSEERTPSVKWRPFRENEEQFDVSVHLYKSILGNHLIFESVNRSLKLLFRYSWNFSRRFGFVREACVRNLSENSVSIRILDGIQNLIPSGLNQAFVNRYSNLADAYKRSELLPSESLGLYYLNSIPTDRAEPSEGLRATVAWSIGLKPNRTLLSSRQLKAFGEGKELSAESEMRGLRGSYLIESEIELEGRQSKKWRVVADIDHDATDVEALRAEIESDSIGETLDQEIQGSGLDLMRKVAVADGLTSTSDKLRDSRHLTNTLYNIMRGGVFSSGYDIDINDFLSYLAIRNRISHGRARQSKENGGLPNEHLDYSVLIKWARDSGDYDLIRLVLEYLPLEFSRRHGDPSRPWNQFSIETEDRAGNPILGYQGNWRDIFQNWETLSFSFPGFLRGMIARFLNSSTADGYNPYRITRDGVEWEIVEPDSPWSNIGYWGDHQIIYLLKLLEAFNRYYPDSLRQGLNDDEYVYTQIPYRIRSFDETVENPRETVDFNDGDAAEIESRCAVTGTDGVSLVDIGGETVRATLVEKLIVPLLAKLSNFVPDGGIWMNTQRPEWNDANNALVGHGVSVVTLCYVNRYREFLISILKSDSLNSEYSLNCDMADFLESLSREFAVSKSRLETGFQPSDRLDLMARLGRAGERFRNKLYSPGLSGGKTRVGREAILGFLNRVGRFVIASLDANKRSDGLYHSYNLLEPAGADGIVIDRLPLMLEGQVAALSSGRLSSQEVVSVLDALRASPLYRTDIGSYILYPDRTLPSFLDKNKLSSESINENGLLSEMLARKDERIIRSDRCGAYRFTGDFRNGKGLRSAIQNLAHEYSEFDSELEAQKIESLFEGCFQHRRFTGRSGAFFAYEGLGSVYWHMVSKLILAIQENWEQSLVLGEPDNTSLALASHYFESNIGLGLNKTPAEYGAFPIDAYSHTPKHAGAQQPGMTGQVKEDLLSRWRELGIVVIDGSIRFEPGLLSRADFIRVPERFFYIDVAGKYEYRDLLRGELAYTVCQTLIIYTIGDENTVCIVTSNGESSVRSGNSLTREESSAIFSRENWIREIRVTLAPNALRVIDPVK